MKFDNDLIDDGTEVLVQFKGADKCWSFWATLDWADAFVKAVSDLPDGVSHVESLWMRQRLAIQHSQVAAIFYTTDPKCLEVMRTTTRLGHQRFLQSPGRGAVDVEMDRVTIEGKAVDLERMRLNVDKARKDLEKEKASAAAGFGRSPLLGPDREEDACP